MAILLVKIEDEQSLAFNEFYDYNGFCYASTRPRKEPGDRVIDMTSFYDAAITTEMMRDIPVVFATVENAQATVLGWYRKAEISSRMHTLSFFLEGNIVAYASDAVWLPKEKQSEKMRWFGGNRLYEVIEAEDDRFRPFQKLMSGYSGENQMIRYHSAEIFTTAQSMKDVKSISSGCNHFAALVAGEKCRDIRDVKTLETFAKKLCEKDKKNPDGYYYLALADYHLGFAKEGLKQVGKALQLEPEASDLIALKGMLLVSREHFEDGAACLKEAYEKSREETYLEMAEQALCMAGKTGL